MQPNILIQSLMRNIQQKNPQGFQTANALIQSKKDPKAFLQQIMSGVTPEQRKGIINQARQYGCPTEILSMVQNMK